MSSSRKCYGEVDLCQLHTKHHFAACKTAFCTQFDKDLLGRNILQLVIIDSTMYLLMINSPDVDNVAMSLYDIITAETVIHTYAMTVTDDLAIS